MQLQSINTRSLISGDMLTIPYYEWKGSPDHPSTYIQAGIHGQEHMGYGVALCLIEHFKQNPPKGHVTIVPKANPYGMNVKMGDTTYGRFDPTTGANWNRNYSNWLKNPEAFIQKHQGKSWPEVKAALKEEAKQALTQTPGFPDVTGSCAMRVEPVRTGIQNITLNPGSAPCGLVRETSSQLYQNKLARQLQNLASQHDILLDLHCDGISLPYIYCQDYALNYAKQLGFDYHLTASRHFKESFDDASIYPFWTVFEKMGFPIDQIDMMALTLELGSKEYFDLEKCQDFADRIVRFLETPYSNTGFLGVTDSSVARVESVSIGINKKELNPDSAPFGFLREVSSQQYACDKSQFIDIYSPQAGMLYDFAPLGKFVPAGQPLCFLLATHNGISPLSERIIPITYHLPCTPIAHTQAGSVHEGVYIISCIL